MSRFFKPYEGKRPYLFVSYSHAQSEEVVDTIRLMYERRCRVWYDEGIPAGGDWPKNIALHMEQSAGALFFLSKSALRSPNCFSEVKTALAQNKRVLVIPLEEAERSEEWQELLDKCSFLEARGDARERAETILESEEISPSFFRRPLENFRWDRLGMAASVLFFALTVAVLYGLFTGLIVPPGAEPPIEENSPVTAAPSPTPTEEVDLSAWESLFPVSFPDKQQERAIRRALGKEGDEDILLHDLPGVTELYFCGNMLLRNVSGVSIESDGTVKVNGAKVAEGRVADLSLIGRMPYLNSLALIRQPVRSLSALSELTQLRELWISATPVEDLSALGTQPSLEELHLEHGAARDLTPLGAMPSLRTVTVSADMIPLRWDNGAAFDVILVP